jgi:hypothetical protein
MGWCFQDGLGVLFGGVGLVSGLVVSGVLFGVVFVSGHGTWCHFRLSGIPCGLWPCDATDGNFTQSVTFPMRALRDTPGGALGSRLGGGLHAGYRAFGFVSSN